jgi:hypothetical protein
MRLRKIFFISILAISYLSHSCVDDPTFGDVDLSRYPKSIAGLTTSVWYLEGSDLVHYSPSTGVATKVSVPAENAPKEFEWDKIGRHMGFIDQSINVLESAPLNIYDYVEKQLVFVGSVSCQNFLLSDSSSFAVLDLGSNNLALTDRNEQVVDLDNFVEQLINQDETSSLQYIPGFIDLFWLSDRVIVGRREGTITRFQETEPLITDFTIGLQNYPDLELISKRDYDQAYIPSPDSTYSYQFYLVSTNSRRFAIRNNVIDESVNVATGLFTEAGFLNPDVAYLTTGTFTFQNYIYNIPQEDFREVMPQMTALGDMSVSPDGNFVVFLGLPGQFRRSQAFAYNIMQPDSAWISEDRDLQYSYVTFGPPLRP